MRFFYLLLFCMLSLSLGAQRSTFDTNNEGWKADGDPVSTSAVWHAAGGLPGGHIRVTDDATGGIWYFVAPVKFKGNKCDSYDRKFSYDQFTSDTLNQIFSNNPSDVEIIGNGQTMVFDHPNNPGLGWTHYEMPLRENAGWRLDDANGPTMDEAQFRFILSGITSIRIKGEYRSSADFGGLDNVIFETTYEFDLDADDSSGSVGVDFTADTVCMTGSPVVDQDVLLRYEGQVDSILVRIVGPGSTDRLTAGALPPSLSVIYFADSTYLLLVNNGNASLADFMTGLQAIWYQDVAPNPEGGERIVVFNVFTECGSMAGACYAYIPLFPPRKAGLDGDTTICNNGSRLDLRTVLNGTPDPGGFWSPLPAGGSDFFDPLTDAPGAYRYILSPVGGCPGDTAIATVATEFLPALRADTTICYSDTLILSVPDGLLQWQWNDGSHQRERVIDFPGTYLLTGTTEHCTFTDNVQVGMYTCEPCLWYAPNIFSPNDDGENDSWQVFLPCLWQRYRLEIFDRWGSLVFAADDPETGWDGYQKATGPIPGVYIWRIEWVSELLGLQQTHRAAGDLTILR